MPNRRTNALPAFLWLLFIMIQACYLPVGNIISPQTVDATQSTIPEETLITPPSLETQVPTIEPSEEIPKPPILSSYKLAVIFVIEGDVLNIRAKPGADQNIIGLIAPHTTDVTPSGQFQWVDGNLWLEVKTQGEGSGWVNSYFLTPQVNPIFFCNDNRINDLITQFVVAIQQRNGEKLSALVNPAHGLAIRHEWWNPEVRFKNQQAVANLFADTNSYDWGIQNGSGLLLRGTFNEIILPRLDDVLGHHLQHCNNLDHGVSAGGTAGYVKWPFEYTNLNYITLFREAPEGDELNWRTWVIGIEYVGGDPYIVVMVQYHWEI